MKGFRHLNLWVPDPLYKSLKIESAKSGESIKSIVTKSIQDTLNGNTIADAVKKGIDNIEIKVCMSDINHSKIKGARHDL